MDYKKLNPYTLAVDVDLSADGKLTTIFNFMSKQVTTIYTGKIDHVVGLGAAALTSQMVEKPFSAFDSKEEIQNMREKLIGMDGNPPPL